MTKFFGGPGMKALHKRKSRLAAALRHLPVVSGEIGAGEGIRTLDPNLGKVVLYH